MVVFRIIYNLFIKLLALLYLPWLWVQQHPLLTIGAVIFLFIQLSGGSDEPTQATHSGASGQPIAAVPAIDPILRYENGNSAFSSDLLSAMNAQELMAYSHIFYQSMYQLPDGKPHDWQSGNMHGKITISRSFRNKQRAICRHFDEVLKVKTVQQTFKGMACQRGDGSWCRLRADWTPACNLGRKPGFGSWWSDTKRGLRNIF